MEDSDEYELLPHEQIEHLRRELEKLKNNPFVKSHEGDQLFGAVKNLTESVDKLYELFSNVQEDLVKEYAETKGEGKSSEKMDLILEQNKHIAEGIMSLADRLEKTESKLNTPKSDENDFTTEIKEVPKIKLKTHHRRRIPVVHHHSAFIPEPQEPPRLETYQKPPVPQEPSRQSMPPQPEDSSQNNEVEWEIPDAVVPEHNPIAQNLNKPPFPMNPNPSSLGIPSYQNRTEKVPLKRPPVREVPPRIPNIPPPINTNNITNQAPHNVPPAFNPNYPPNVSRTPSNSTNIIANVPPQFNPSSKQLPSSTLEDDFIDPNFPKPSDIPAVPDKLPKLATPISVEPKKKKFLGIF